MIQLILLRLRTFCRTSNIYNHFHPSIYPVRGVRQRRTLLERMLLRGTTLPPKYATTWVSHDWLQDCKGSSSSAEQIQAAMLVLTRGDDDVLIPIYDLYNHRNGKWFNTRAHVVEHVKYELTASRDLQTGRRNLQFLQSLYAVLQSSFELRDCRNFSRLWLCRTVSATVDFCQTQHCL